MRHIKLFLLLLILAPQCAFAVLEGTPAYIGKQGEQGTPFNFGTIYMDYNPGATLEGSMGTGNTVSLNRGEAMDDGEAGKIYVAKSWATTRETIEMTASGGTLSNSGSPCTITLSNHIFTPTQHTYTGTFLWDHDNPPSSARGWVYWRSSISIPGNCTEGTYTGTVLVAANAIASNVPTNNRTANLDVSVTIAWPIKIANLATLDFGTIVIPRSGSGTVTVNTAGNRTVSGLVVAGTTAAGSFSVLGRYSTNFYISMPTSATISNGTDTLTVSNFTPASGTYTFSGSGTYTLGVGATLTVPSNISPGTYTGQYSITVSYP